MFYWKNDLTKELDGIKTKRDTIKGLETYMLDPMNPVNKDGRIWIPIRVPGCTVGVVIIDENHMITDIKINGDDFCPYTSKDAAESLMKKYIGQYIRVSE